MSETNDRKGQLQVGDFTVTPFPGGHLIGQLRAKVGAGPGAFGWSYEGKDENTQAAIRKAAKLAKDTKTAAAWMYEPDGTYHQIPTDSDPAFE